MIRYALAMAILAIAVGSAAHGTPPSFNDMIGAWSPDGRRIAFTSDRTGDPEIFVANADGSELHQLTDMPGRDAHPSWSPDGRRILFQSPRHNGHTRIFVMNADGSDQRVLARTMGFCGVPIWSRDGRRIAFQCSPVTSGFGQAHTWWRIFMMNEDGSNLRAVTHGPGNDQVPSWSPSGSSLLFFSDRSGVDQLYEFDLRNRRIDPLTAGDAHHSAAFSPDGSRIALMRAPAGERADVYLLDRRSGAYRRLTTNGPQYGTPQFSPDGTRLLFQSPTDRGLRLHVLRLDADTGPSVIEFRSGR